MCLVGIQVDPSIVNGGIFLSKRISQNFTFMYLSNLNKCICIFRQRCVLDGIQFNPSSVERGYFSEQGRFEIGAIGTI